MRLALALTVLSLAATLTGCGEKDQRSKGPGTPRECWDQFQVAVASKDHAALYDLLSMRDHATLGEQLVALKVLNGDDLKPAADALGYTPEQLKKAKTRDYFIRVCDRAANGVSDTLAGATVESVAETGNNATLTVRTADGKRHAVPLVREQLASQPWQKARYGWFLVLVTR